MGKVLQFTGNTTRLQILELEKQAAVILNKYRKETDPTVRAKLHDEYGALKGKALSLALEALRD